MSDRRGLLAQATPRPWTQDGGTWRTPNGYAVATRNWINDTALIVAAVNDYEALLELEAHLRASNIAWHAGIAAALARLDAIRLVAGAA